MGFAQRLLLGRQILRLKLTLQANEENTFNINDLWVSAAVAQDTAVFDDEDEADLDEDNEAVNDTPSHSLAPTPGSDRVDRNSQQGSVARRFGRNRISSGGMGGFKPLPGHRLSVSQGGRRFSTSSGQMPTIFSNTGLAMQPGIALNEESPGFTSPEATTADPFFPPQNDRRPGPVGGLSVIAERPSAGRANPSESSPLVSPTVEMTEKPTSTWKALPLMMIIQVSPMNSLRSHSFAVWSPRLTRYDARSGVLVFPGDVSPPTCRWLILHRPYRSGGLGLNPASFSFLIALMCLFQLVYQFYLYPRLGPPLGRFSHLQMFRIGCSLYIPSYLALPLLHSVASPDYSGGFVVMTCELRS